MLIGGSESEVRESYTHGFFHEGTKSYVARMSQQVEVRILPAFGTNIKQTSKGYSTSVAAYRDRNAPDDHHTKTPGFSSFYYAVSGYTWFGEGKHSFLSPLTGGRSNRSGVCPAYDVYKMCFKNDDSTLHSLTQQRGKESALVSRVRSFGLLNCYMNNPVTNEDENCILVITSSSLNQLKKRLSLRAGREDPIITEEFKEFLYGDVTDPETGSTAFIRETNIEDNPMLKFAGLFFSDKDGYLKGREENKISSDVLSGRYDISDTNNVTKLQTYDDILELMVSDGAVPYDIIVRACSRYAENGVPDEHKGTTTVTPVMPTSTAAPEETNTIPAPVPAMVSNPSIETDRSEDTKDADLKAVEVPQVTNLSTEDHARFSELHSKYESKGPEMNTEELSEYFTLRIKSGVTED